MWLQRKNKNRANLGSRTRKILSASKPYPHGKILSASKTCPCENPVRIKFDSAPVRIETLSLRKFCPLRNPSPAIKILTHEHILLPLAALCKQIIETLPPRQNSIRIENLSLRKFCPHRIRPCPCPHRNPAPATKFCPHRNPSPAIKILTHEHILLPLAALCKQITFCLALEYVLPHVFMVTRRANILFACI